MSADAAAKLFEPPTGRAQVNPPQDRWGNTYGYCNFHHGYGGYDIYTHGGGRPGFGTLFWLIPDQDFAIAITHNASGTNYFESEIQFAVDCYLNDQCK
jgi:CubicO group peptidase (beta-lactamase class C family)